MIPIMAIGAIAQGLGGLMQMQQGKADARRAREAADEARIELDKQKALFEGLDTSNPYLNLENNMEDLTVNLKQAEFTRDQQMQSQANIMQQMRQAAGGSGIAALAQTLANQGAIDAQKAAASIGTQEAANQKLAAEEASKIQGLEREGELISRQAQFGKVQSLMGLASGDLRNANQARANAQDQISSGMAGMAAGAMNFGAAGGFGALQGGTGASIQNKSFDVESFAANNFTTPPNISSNQVTTPVTQPNIYGNELQLPGTIDPYSFNATQVINGVTYQLQADGTYKPI